MLFEVENYLEEPKVSLASSSGSQKDMCRRTTL
jgi:hypothetical protein